MRALAAPAIWLERHTHCRNPLQRKNKNGRNVDPIQRIGRCQSATPVPRHGCPSLSAVVQSRPPAYRRRGSPRSFPQLWKKMWKSTGFKPTGART
jgi:hypothetical protein